MWDSMWDSINTDGRSLNGSGSIQNVIVRSVPTDLDDSKACTPAPPLLPLFRRMTRDVGIGSLDPYRHPPDDSTPQRLRDKCLFPSGDFELETTPMAIGT